MARLVETDRPWSSTPALRAAILTALREHPDGVTINRLAELAGRGVPTVRTHLDTMYAQGLVIRTRTPARRDLPSPPYLWRAR
jgi:DNA-binding transcriptional ArsR family regulator